MLSALHIENVAVIKELDLSFSGGLSVLTGETGAGKSILIASLMMLLGARSDRDVIRKGEDYALVEGLFCLIDRHSAGLLKSLEVFPDENGELLLSRRLSSDGRNNCRINGKSVPLGTLKNVGRVLLGIHGQHDTQTLLSEETHLPLIDRFGSCEEQLSAYRKAYADSVALKNRLTSLLSEEQEKQTLTEKFRKAVKEIGEAKLKRGEEEQLEARRKIVRDAQKLSKQARIVERALYKNEKGSSASDLIEIAQTALEQLSEVLEKSGEFVKTLSACRAQLEEIALTAGEISQVAGDNPTEELNRIEDRLDLIRALKKRYGETEEEVLEYALYAGEQLKELQNRDKVILALKEELESAVEQARSEAAKLSAQRKKAAKTLEDAVNSQMAFLDLDKVRFKVGIEENLLPSGKPKLSSVGQDEIRFLITTNPGEPFKPLASIASGGELSRIMLALKVALADKESTPTIIFDEIDTGISGKTSQKIGIKLREIGRFTQVFCVTHSAQVSACGHHHFLITKSEVNGRSVTAVKELSREERVEEIARIMGGIHVTDSVRKGALELLEDGQK